MNKRSVANNLNCGIYQIRNIVTGVCYVGQSIDLNDRKRHHWANLKNNKHRNSYLQNSFNKHRRKDFIFEVLVYCEPFELTRYEQSFVDRYKKKSLLYNICLECVDSQKGVVRSQESIDKRRKSMPNQSGKNNHFFGKHHTKETKELLSLKNKGKKCSLEHNLKISLANKEKRCGKENPFYGRTHTAEVIMRIRKANVIKKETVLKVQWLLNKNLSQTKVAEYACVCRDTVRNVKNGYYDKIHNLKRVREI